MTHPMTPEQIAEGRALVACGDKVWSVDNDGDLTARVSTCWREDAWQDETGRANAALAVAAVNAYPAYLDLCAEQANMPLVDGRAMTASEAKAAIGFLSERVGRLERAVLAVADAVAEYLPPDGISRDDLISRVIFATDNPQINPVIEDLRHGRH